MTVSLVGHLLLNRLTGREKCEFIPEISHITVTLVANVLLGHLT